MATVVAMVSTSAASSLFFSAHNSCIFSAPSIARLRSPSFSIICSIAPRDIPIDFGKFKGSKLGTLPSSYLRWLVREVSDTRFDVWATYAEQVLQDPYYQDRLEWESIEKLALKADMRKGGPPVRDDAGVKNKMKALGWDLSDHSGWNKVNFSLLGTTLGGRIPRKKDDETRDHGNNPTSDFRRKGLPSSKPVSRPRSTTRFANESKQKGLSNDSVIQPEHSESSSLREELLRRRLLRKKIIQPRTATSLQKPSGHGNPQFPGRDSFLKKMEQNKLER